MRMILDCRRPNRCFAAPPGVELVSAEGSARIEVEVDDAECPEGSSWEAEEKWLSALRVTLGVADVRDCFHRLRLPSELSRWFCYPGGTAAEFGLTGVDLE